MISIKNIKRTTRNILKIFDTKPYDVYLFYNRISILFLRSSIEHILLNTRSVKLL